MGLIYEHWRPDTNECFYVGASRDAEDARPYEYGHHNEDYDAVVTELAEKGVVPFTKIIWDGLPRDCTYTYEKMRIAYQRALLGEKLTNRARGGEGFNIDWNDKLRDQHSEIRQAFLASEDGKIWGENHSSFLDDYWNGENGESNREAHSSLKIAFYSTPEGQACIDKIKQTLSEYLESPAGIAQCERISEERLDFFQTPEGIELRKHLSRKATEQFETQEAREAHSEILRSFLESDEGVEWCATQSQRKLDFYASPEGEAWKKEHGEKHRIKMTAVWQTDEHRAKIDAFHQSAEGAEWSEKNSAMVTDLWKTHDYRMKMLPERWYQSNVRYQRYWGA
jgi:hypothetical protein